ncbi:jg3024 [Pararge aegeria aegeria]|uniref:Jg3024 protein n=1 Tax=Pararge aegeria aegeria TaxID=348720 RepID=A0A8S4QM31_9NEOP|nr:jg3024 [Pararge aegeria aegeria]
MVMTEGCHMLFVMLNIVLLVCNVDRLKPADILNEEDISASTSRKFMSKTTSVRHQATTSTNLMKPAPAPSPHVTRSGRVVKKLDKLNTSHLGIPGIKRAIYVMEHLSLKNKKLHAATRLAAKEQKYEYVWIRNGRIFVRKNNESGALWIKNTEALSNLN